MEGSPIAASSPEHSYTATSEHWHSQAVAPYEKMDVNRIQEKESGNTAAVSVNSSWNSGTAVQLFRIYRDKIGRENYWDGDRQRGNAPQLSAATSRCPHRIIPLEVFTTKFPDTIHWPNDPAKGAGKRKQDIHGRKRDPFRELVTVLGFGWMRRRFCSSKDGEDSHGRVAGLKPG